MAPCMSVENCNIRDTIKPYQSGRKPDHQTPNEYVELTQFLFTPSETKKKIIESLLNTVW